MRGCGFGNGRLHQSKQYEGIQFCERGLYTVAFNMCGMMQKKYSKQRRTSGAQKQIICRRATHNRIYVSDDNLIPSALCKCGLPCSKQIRPMYHHTRHWLLKRAWLLHCFSHLAHGILHMSTMALPFTTSPGRIESVWGRLIRGANGRTTRSSALKNAAPTCR